MAQNPTTASFQRLAKRIALHAAPLWDPLHVAWFRRSRHWRGPIPPFANRRRVGAWPAAYYLSSGQSSRDDVSRALLQYTGRPLHDLHALDLACGPGRIAQHFDGAFRSLAACDVDPSAVAFLRRHYPAIATTVNDTQPPLPFEHSSFDVVYSWSLWTHLSRKLQQRFLDELDRILRPGGWALITTNGHRWLDKYHACPRVDPYWLTVTHDDLRRQGTLYRPYDSLDQGPTGSLTGIPGTYGLALHDPWQIREEWSQYLEVVTVEEGSLCNRQDLVVLRRPA